MHRTHHSTSTRIALNINRFIIVAITRWYILITVSRHLPALSGCLLIFGSSPYDRTDSIAAGTNLKESRSCQRTVHTFFSTSRRRKLLDVKTAFIVRMTFPLKTQTVSGRQEAVTGTFTRRAVRLRKNNRNPVCCFLILYLTQAFNNH